MGRVQAAIRIRFLNRQSLPSPDAYTRVAIDFACMNKSR